MPELPEVETIVRELRERVLKRPISRAVLRRADMLRCPQLKRDHFYDFFRGRAFDELERRGKFMLFWLDDRSCLLAHLGMTGKFVISDANSPDPDYLCSQYFFENGKRLDHLDVRRLGRLELYKPASRIPLLERLGPDPLSPLFSCHVIERLTCSKDWKRPRQQAIHTLLLNQSLISGVGNIYASEALFRSGIRPDRPGGQLEKNDCAALAADLLAVMLEALTNGGTTINDYRRVDDKPGNFLKLLRVYGREGQPCRNCGTPIGRIRLGGRSAFFCNKCQK